MHIVIYYKSNGKIRSVEGRGELTTDEELEEYMTDLSLELGEEIDYIESSTPISLGDQYVDINTSQLEDKTTFTGAWNKTVITADDIDEAILSGLPLNTPIKVDGVEIQVADGSFEFSTSDAGFYKVVLDTPQFYKETWEITANEV